MAATRRRSSSGTRGWLTSSRYSTSTSRLLRLTCTWTKPNQLKLQAAGRPPPAQQQWHQAEAQILQVFHLRLQAAQAHVHLHQIKPIKSSSGWRPTAGHQLRQCSDPLNLHFPANHAQVHPRQIRSIQNCKRLAANSWAPKARSSSGISQWLRSSRYSTSASRLLRLSCTYTKPNQFKSASGWLPTGGHNLRQCSDPQPNQTN
jgi:hypothetical protein